MPFPSLYHAKVGAIVAALAERGDAVAARVYTDPVRRNCSLS
jgi:hypothetical protein